LNRSTTKRPGIVLLTMDEDFEKVKEVEARYLKA
jgi:hypothetical protein